MALTEAAAGPLPALFLVRRVRPLARVALAGALAGHALLLGLLVAGGPGVLGGGHRSTIDALGAWLAVLAASGLLARGILVAHDRAAWVLIGISFYGAAAGALGAQHDAALVVYDLGAITGTAMLLRSRTGTLSDVLDPVASGLAVAAAAAAAITISANDDFDHQIVIASGDIVLVGLAAAVLVASGRRSGRGALLLAAGFATTALADALLLPDDHAFASISSHPAAAGRPLCALLVAAAAWHWRPVRSDLGRARVPLAAPCAALLALAVLLTDTLAPVGRLPHLLAALAILAVTARTVSTLRRQSFDAEQLRSAEERYRTLVEEMPAVTYIADLGAQGEWHYVSPQVAELLGYTPEEFLHRPSLWIDIVHPDDRAGVLHCEEALRRDGAALEIEYRMIARDGRTLQVRDEAVKVGPDRVLGFLLDVTARRTAELDARRRAAQQSLVARLGQHALAGASPEELFDVAGRGIATALGVELTEVLELLPMDGRLLLRAGVGWQPGLVGHAFVDPQSETLAGATLREGAPIVVHDLRTETRFSGPPLLHRHGVVSAMTTVIADGNETFGVLGALSTQHRTFTLADVDFLQGVAHALAAALRSRRAEVAIRQAEGRFRRVLEGAPDAIVGVGPDGLIVLVNDRAVELFGSEELVGWPWRELGAGLFDRPANVTHLRARRADGSEFPADVSVSSLEHGALLLASIRDVSEREREQNEREGLRAQLEQSQRLETIGQLAGGIAHDFNNILLVIQARAAFLADKLPDEAARENVAKIVDAVDSAAALTRQLLQFSGRRHIEPVLVDVNDVAARVYKLLDRSLGSGVHLELGLGDGLPPVKADPSQLEQVLLNLAVNARDAMPDGGEVRIETSLVQVASATAQGHVRIRVSDTGVGMTPEVREHIFDPFFTTKPPDKGTGLGLATVHGIVTGAGGHLVVRSVPGAGTEIDVCLPVAA